MASRPSLLELRADSSQSAASTSSRPLRSPRMHVAGEAPLELSPLDAFALQSRLLARQLQETTKEGNRVSRLPPLTVESPLVQQGRSEFFRAFSHDSASETEESPGPPTSGGLGLRGEVEEAFAPKDRPKSVRPRMSRIPPTPDDAIPLPALPEHAEEESRGRQLEPVGEHIDYFGARQERSPSPLQSDSQSNPDLVPERSSSRKDLSLLHPILQRNVSASSSPDKSKQGSFDELGLAPPRGPIPRRSPSVVSSPMPDEDTFSTISGSLHSLPSRKLSAASVALASAVPSPAISSFQRSPSAASDSSVIPRPSLNFSRPISRAGTPSLEMPTRQASSDSQPSFILADDSAHTPVSMHSEAFIDHQTDDGKVAAPSYIYSTFCLPRGKTIQRSGTPEGHSPASSKWERSTRSPSSAHRAPLGAPPSPPTRPSSSSARPAPDDAVSVASSTTRPSMDASKISMESSRLGVAGHPNLGAPRPSVETGRRSEDAPRGRSLTSSPRDLRGKAPASVGTSNSAGTVRPSHSSRVFGPSASEMSAEEHLAKGIECHESGSLNESTYHLRHAARQNNPTAMLLYALACRHGWGMRANQKEGVEWLRKAAEYASVEIADDQDRAREGRPANFLESKTRKAQFALSIYELGVSHMNGWGIEQDKSLALRCFEIAGSWGDVDALAEAGFCYAKGVGCKKDLKKSAKFYRMAEAKGMSMVGNSWIHKSKYNEGDNGSSPKEKNRKKARSKSRTRAMFGLKPGS
ncbi:cell cycle inhibitor Nif1 [Hirsutella rhossiliensis]|uniref:Cell cycle inhibitor Nif1 n=1 Tax=Hirsutella rhossiliensis TaxID=111463 RepID=A0A9P8SHY8_9HYPO|nr:cell cycle inhibitor Nif1 [Hirsutella rhossiliensis]KAH0963301.1 cell cycle inhibitor Nif1 [Hirsutella rhossiliensis]